MQDRFCVLPFIHSCTNVGGRNKPCCRFSDEYYNDNVLPDDYFYGEKLDKLRQEMLEGKYVSGCKKCYEEEENGQISYRQKANKDFSVDVNNPTIKFIEIGISNSCNFACVTCDAAYSTSWWKDIDAVNKIGANKAKPTQQVVYTNFDFKDLSEVTHVKLLGGEPFMEPKNIEFLEKLPLEKTTIILVTNGSILPNKKWLDIIDRCKKLYIDISIDGFRKNAEFVRHGTNWKKLKANCKWWYNFRYQSKEYSNKVILNYHFVVHSLNVLGLNEYITWHKNYLGEKLPTFDICKYPSYLDIKNLPKKIKQRIINECDLNHVNEYLEKNINNSNKLECIKLINYVDKLIQLRGRTKSDNVTCLIEELKNEATYK